LVGKLKALWAATGDELADAKDDRTVSPWEVEMTGALGFPLVDLRADSTGQRLFPMSLLEAFDQDTISERFQHPCSNTYVGYGPMGGELAPPHSRGALPGRAK
jgi:hypothetical protein